MFDTNSATKELFTLSLAAVVAKRGYLLSLLDGVWADRYPTIYLTPDAETTTVLCLFLGCFGVFADEDQTKLNVLCEQSTSLKCV